MPLLVAGLAIPSSMAVIFIVAQQIEMSIFVLNIATMLGLALAIDYSLFIVSRYREELRRGRTVGEAVERAVGTAGKAVAFSGIAVAIGLSGLMLFVAPAIRSIGIAGAIVVLCSVVFALTFLPAVLGMLGHRVNALSIGGLRHRFRPVADGVEVARTGRWERVAHAVMRRPIAVLVPTLAILLIAGTPFLRLEQGVPGAEIYPPGVESRDAYVALQTEFAPGETTPIIILADVTGDPLSPESIAAFAAYSAQLDAIEGVDRVEGPFTLHDPATGAALTPDQVAALYALPADQQPPGLDALLAQYVRGSTVRLDAISPLAPSTPDATDMIPVIRAHRCRRRDRDRRRRQRGAGPRLPRVAGRARAVCGRPDAARQRPDPVPPVRLGRAADQGRAHDPAVDHRQLRRDGLDLPGGQPVRAAQLRAARVHHRGQPDHHVQRHLRAVDGLRGPAPVARSRRPTGGPATTPPRWPRGCPRPPGSSPARR